LYSDVGIRHPLALLTTVMVNKLGQSQGQGHDQGQTTSELRNKSGQTQSETYIYLTNSDKPHKLHQTWKNACGDVIKNYLRLRMMSKCGVADQNLTELHNNLETVMAAKRQVKLEKMAVLDECVSMKDMVTSLETRMVTSLADIIMAIEHSIALLHSKLDSIPCIIAQTKA
jgi:hypothetical protein